MRNRWLRFSALMLAAILVIQAPMETMGAVEAKKMEGTEEGDSKSLKELWDDLMESIDLSFDALLSADQEEIKELAPIAVPVEEKLLDQVYRLAEQEQGIEPQGLGTAQAEPQGIANSDPALQDTESEEMEEMELAQIPSLRKPPITDSDEIYLSYTYDDEGKYYEKPTWYYTDYSNQILHMENGGEYHLRDVTIEAMYGPGIDVNGAVTLYVDGPVNIKGSRGFAGIRVPEGSTLTIRGKGTLSVQGGNAENGGNANGRYGGAGGCGAGAGIGGNGGAGGGTAAAGQNGETAGRIIILDELNKFDIKGGAGGNGGNGAAGESGKVVSAMLYIGLWSGDAGGGGGGGGYPAADIGGGGAGGGGGSNGVEGDDDKSSIDNFYTHLKGTKGGDGGRGYCNGGGGGGGGDASNSGVATQRGVGGGGGAGGWPGQPATDGKNSIDDPGKLGEVNSHPGIGGTAGGENGGIGGSYGGARGEIYCMTSATQVGGQVVGSGQGRMGQNTDSSYERIYDLTDGNATVSMEDVSYTGVPLNPQPVVKWKNVVINPNYYTIRYENNLNVGQAGFTVVGGYDKNTPVDTTKPAYGSISGAFHIGKAQIAPSITTTAATVSYGIPFIASVTGNSGNAQVTGWRFTKGEGTIEPMGNGSVKVTPSKTGEVLLEATVGESSNYAGAVAATPTPVVVMGKSIANATIEVIPQQTYTGNEITPEVKVYLGGVKLAVGTDVQVDYTNHTNCGTATVTVTGIGNYQYQEGGKPFSISTQFTIVPRQIGDSLVTMQPIAAMEYDGLAKTPEVRLQFNGKELVKGTDYTLQYSSNTNVGTNTASVIISGAGNFKGMRQERFTITQADIRSNKVEVAPIDDVVFSGLKQEPALSVTYTRSDGKKVVLVKETDYTVTFANHITAGMAQVTINGKGNFKMSRTASFTIQPKPLTVRADDQFLEYAAGGMANPAFTYTVTGEVSGYKPVFTGKLTRENPTVFNANVYKIIPDSAAPLQLSTAGADKAVNQNYTYDAAAGYTAGYMTIGSSEVITAEAVLKVQKNGTLVEQAPDGEGGWYQSQVYICAPSGFTISTSNSFADTNQWKDRISYSDGDFTQNRVGYYLKRDGDNAISQAKLAPAYKQDTVAPTGSIVAGSSAWNGYGSGSTFTYSFQNAVLVTFHGSDDLSGVPLENDDNVTETGIRYLVTDQVLTEAQLKIRPDNQWSRGTEYSFDSPKGIVYAEIKDRAGNRTYIRSGGLMVDGKAPSLAITAQPPVNAWTDVKTPVIKGTVTDPLSALKDRYVTYEIGPVVDGIPNYGYPFEIKYAADNTFTIELPDLDDGKYGVRISAQDNAGNTSTVENIPVWIDRTAPVYDMDAMTIAPGTAWTNQNITITPSVTDAAGGVAKTEYSLDGGTTWNTYSNSFVINRDGLYDEILLRAADVFGNQTVTVKGQIVVRRDTLEPAAPVVTANGSAYGTDVSGNRWYRGDKSPTIVVPAVEDTRTEAPVKAAWKLWKNGTSEPGTWNREGSTTLPSEGEWNFKYKNVDEAGNESSTNTMFVRWDKTSPAYDGSGAWEIKTVNSSGAAAVANTVSFGMFYKEALEVTVHVADAGGSGLKSLSYSLNGQTPVSIALNTKRFELPLDTKGTVAIYAEDGAGNRTSTMILNADGNGNLVVENKPPVIKILPQSSPNETGWYKENVTLSVEIYDEDSGLASISGRAGGTDVSYVLNRSDQVKSKNFEVNLTEGPDVRYEMTAIDNAGTSAVLALTEGNGYKIDKTAPTAGMVLDVPYAERSEFYGKAVNVKLTAEDPLSGLSAYSYSFDGGATWSETQPWPSGEEEVPLTLSEDGSYSIGFRVWDLAGNEQAAQLLYAAGEDGSLEPVQNRIVLDRVAPEVPLLQVEPGAGGSLNDDGWYNGEEPVFSLKMPEGAASTSKERYYWYAVSEGGSSAMESRLVWNVPSKDGDMDSDNLNAEGLISVPRNDWGATKDNSDGTKSLVFGDPVEGAYDFYYFSRDAAENESELQKKTVRWDATAPVFGEFTFNAEDGSPIDGFLNYLKYGNYYTAAVRVTVPVTDPVDKDSDPDKQVAVKASGIKKVTYSINGSESLEAVDGRDGTYSFLIPKDTVGKITVTAVDTADNATSTYVLGTNGSNDWSLESTLPDIGPITASASEASADRNGVIWYTSPVTFTSEITDTGSGIKEVKATHVKAGGNPDNPLETETVSDNTYPLGGSAFESSYTWREESDGEAGIGEGNPYTVNVVAADNAGNTQSRTQDFYIDLTKPVLTMVLGEDKDYTYPDWCGNPLLTLTAADAVSGVDGLSYTFDGGASWSVKEDYDGTELQITVPDGSYPKGKIGIRVWDLAGNCYDTLEEGDDLSFNTDTSNPASGVLTAEPCQGGAFITEHGEEWYNGITGPQIAIIVEESDGSTAPVHYYWCLKPEGEAAPDGSAPDQWTQDTPEKLVLPDEGRYVVYWYVKDEAGNQSDQAAPKSQIIRYDRTRISYQDPEVTFSKINRGAMERLGHFITGGNYFKEAVRITVYTADSMSHPAQVYYSLDLGRTWKVMKTDSQMTDENRAFYFDLTTDTDGTVQIWYYAVDRAGNQEEVRKLKGENGSLEWMAEEKGPVIDDYSYEEPVNQAGWFNQSVHVNIPIRDNLSGVATATASCAVKAEETSQILDENDWSGGEQVEKAVDLNPVIDFDCTDLLLTVTAADNSGNTSERTELISRDTIYPKISGMEGWPEEPTNENQTITFLASDERSGMSAGSIQVTKDGSISIPVTYEVKDGLNVGCSFETQNNGSYQVSVTDTAGNTTVFEREETLIDTAGTAGVELKVLLNPALPDGENGWYRNTPTIEIIPPVQVGASPLTTRYTLYPEGENEPEGTVFLITEGVGTSGAEGKTVQQPQIPSDGRWNLHVWVENVFGDRLEYETLIKVDTKNPYDLTIGSLPKDKVFEGAYEIWINRDKSLSARAKDDTSGVYVWCYSLDKGATWTGWRDWSGLGSIKIDRDIVQQNSILFRVKDEAGNETVSEAVTVLRDTDEPWLYLALANGLDTIIGVEEPLLFYMNEEVWQLPGNNGNVRVWDYDSRSLYCVVKARDTAIDVNRHDRTVEVKLPVKLEPGTRYYVDITPDFVTDQAGNVNGVCGGYGVWEFITEGDQNPNTVIQGFDIDLTSGTPEEHTVRGIKAVREEDGQNYHVIARPEYMAGPDETGQGVKYAVLDIQVLTRGNEAVSLWTGQEGVEVEALEDNRFHLTIPEGTDRLLLQAAPEGAENDAETVTLMVIQSGMSARAAGDLQPSIDEAEVVNRIKLNHELDDTASRIDLTLTVDQKEQAAADINTRAAQYMLGGKLPEGSKVRSLDIGLTKEVRTGSGETNRTSVHTLEGPIHVTMDLEPGLRGFEHLLILRIHEDQAGYIRPEKLDGGTRIRFKTDRFSEYILVGSDEHLIPEQRTDGVVTIKTEADQTKPDEAGTATPSQAAGATAADQWQFPWWILILSAILLLGSYLYYRHDNEPEETEEEADEETEEDEPDD